MDWKDKFTRDNRPDLSQISKFIANPLWQELLTHIEETYEIMPTVQHSICNAAPGWNVKYKKSGRAVCTLYPAAGYFICLVSIGARESMEAELLLGGCTDMVQQLYRQCKPFNGSRWLMIDVNSPEILEDVKALIATRVKSKKAVKHG